MQSNAHRVGQVALAQQQCYVRTVPQDRDPIRKGRFSTLRYLMVVFSFCFFYLPSSAEVSAPTITLTKKNSTLQEVFRAIQKQTDYAFVYNTEMMQKSKRVSIDVRNASLDHVLSLCFQDQPLTYKIVDKIVVVQEKARVATLKDTTQSPGLPSLMNVKGRVLDEQSQPVVKASVTVKGTRKATATDIKGEYLLEAVSDKAVLVISCVGYEPKEVAVGGNDNISTQLKVAVNNLDETIVVAYNTTTQRANTGAVTVIKGEQIATLPNRSFDKSLTGLVPGLAVTPGSGQPGSSPSNFVLRGISTGGSTEFGETVRNPLIVIDGMPVFQETSYTTSSQGGIAVNNPMAQLNPSDIESISVLKDAAAIALYGSKASNGVILVTTKKGKPGKTQISFRTQTDIAKRLDGKVSLLNQAEYLELLFEAYRNSTPGITDSEILADLRLSPSPVDPKFPIIVKAPGDTSFYPAADWLNAAYNNAAVTLSNELSLSGGNERSRFYLNLEYTKQNGVAKNTGYDRKSIRFNYENRLTPWLKIGLNSALSYNIQDYNSESSVLNTLGISPLNPIYKQDGSYIYNYTWGLSFSGYDLQPNPVAISKLNINRNTAFRGLTTLYGELKLLRHLTLTSRVGVDFLLNELKEKVSPFFVLQGESEPGNGRVLEQDFRNANILTTNTLQFSKNFNSKHNVNLLLGQEAQILTSKTMSVEVRGLSKNPDQDQITGNNVYQATGITGKQTQISYFSQANYSFRNKYFLSGSIRTDGSSRFGKNERFGTYWSVGAGWILSEEAFLKNTGSWLDYLKLRGSFGPAGNSSAIYDNIKYDYLYMINTQNGTAVYPERSVPPGNPDIKWEQTLSWNGGLELRMFKERVTLITDIYTKMTRNLIAHNIPLPLATGFVTISDNIGDLKNSGIEISMSVDLIRNRDFRWNVTANWSRNRNKLVKSFFPLQELSGYVANQVGREYNSFYLPVWSGVNPANGRPQWIDSVTGKPTEEYYSAKKEFVGKTQPDGFGAFTTSFVWNGFDFSTMVTYQYGSQIFFNNILQNDGQYPYNNQSKAALNRWQKPGDIALNPRRLLNGRAGTDVDMGTAASTRYLYDGDFFRLANILLGYTFSNRILDKLHLSNLRIYAQAHNLAIWTKYTGRDPANVNGSAGDTFLYPQQRSYSIGLNLSF